MGQASRKLEPRLVDLAEYQSLEETVFGAKRVVPLEKARKAVGDALGMDNDERRYAFRWLPPSLARCEGKPWSWRATLAADVVGLVDRWTRYDKSAGKSVAMLTLGPGLRNFLEKRIKESLPPPYDGLPEGPRAAFDIATADMGHGGPKAPTPFLLSPPIEGLPEVVRGLKVAPRNDAVVAGRSDGFQIWRWCTTSSMRQFIPLLEHPCPAECYAECPALDNTAPGDVMMLELAGFQVKWRGFGRLAPMITLEWNGYILYTAHPEGHSFDVAELGAGNR
jgi:hypothetical protein